MSVNPPLERPGSAQGCRGEICDGEHRFRGHGDLPGLDFIVAPSGIGNRQVDVIGAGRKGERRIPGCSKLRPADRGVLIRPSP